MASLTTTQKVVTVNNSDGDINTEITTQNAAGWVVYSITISGSNVILLFNKINTSLA